MEKENLVLVHSFPTKSILLRGLADYLNDSFETYCIDLPGFTRQVPPLPRISWDAFSRFTESRIRELSLDSYVAAGISFGFRVVNNMAVDEKCRGILGLVPFLGPRS